MTAIERPAKRPANPCFSTGPTAKRPGWSPDIFANALVGRSHRSKDGKARLKRAIDETRKVLGVPADHLIGIVPASDTGAVEMALWSLLGPRGVDVLAWESFGRDWVIDVLKELKLPNVRALEAEYGDLPDLASVDFTRDVVFTWNGTASGVRVPDGDWIDANRQGLTICDATSAAFAMPLPYEKLDVVTFSWQKVMGGEAQHGMIVLSPRAVERLRSHKPAWPVPKVFRLTKGGKLIEGIFAGETINTPSMLAVEDYLDGLAWARAIGGLPALFERADRNTRILEDWAERTPWVGFLARDPATRSNTSVCLTIADPEIVRAGPDAPAAIAKAIVAVLESEKAAYDIAAYRDAPAGLRIWCGGTVEASDVEALLPWLDWAFATQKAQLKAAA
ncbi:phosphoserine transaminase [Faunimonas sp. B44]|uniref:phosphoserine transaminase n=1 Tax=Faunimonas sp. B44 TaxID=3461493 RepID=UPI004043EE1F